jgi:hypothetical protein
MNYEYIYLKTLIGRFLYFLLFLVPNLIYFYKRRFVFFKDKYSDEELNEIYTIKDGKVKVTDPDFDGLNLKSGWLKRYVNLAFPVFMGIDFYYIIEYIHFSQFSVNNYSVFDNDVIFSYSIIC